MMAGAVAVVSGSVTNFSAWAAEPRYEVAAYYFPNYHPNPQNSTRYGTNWTEWNLIKAATPRFKGHQQPKMPLWGYADESNPQVMAKKIAAAADHGVTTFIFDWYWYEGQPFLERGLEQGMLLATNSSRLKFALMWANHEWLELFPAHNGTKPAVVYPSHTTPAGFVRTTDYMIKKYFPQPNYWKIDGKPYFSIYEMMTLVKELGGVDQTRVALDGFRARTKSAGFPDLHLNAVAWGMQPPARHATVKTPADLARSLGVDSVTSYCWMHHVYPDTFPAADYSTLATKSEQIWPKLQAQYPVPFFPNVSMGWDSSPRTTQSDIFENRGYPYTPVVTGNSPKEFRKALERARAYLDAQPFQPRVLTINAWNEWTEGSYLEPDCVRGMAYLKAIKQVFPPPKH